ncbi:hypothetical protein VCRLGP7_120080 [Vibrio crassostreae]|nr:hypothetical protein VCRA2113O197_520002 [Vibrio crassostreae]CAK3990156.1 hypothetical protein VCRA2128O306_460002 [Vibrio crassostreae]CDS97426.1 hypothetical protein VCRLGP7_120080 [Vibrio crassostreae]
MALYPESSKKRASEWLVLAWLALVKLMRNKGITRLCTETVDKWWESERVIGEPPVLAGR